MSVELPLTKERLDGLRRELSAFVCKKAGLSLPSEPKFQSFEDGDMGGFFLLGVENDSAEKKIADCEYHDIDGRRVLLTLYSRDGRFLSSIEFWRLDFGRIMAFPEPEDLIYPAQYDSTQ